MTVSRTMTFQQTVPKRPGESDILNGAKTNATPSVPPNMASAEEYEQMARLLVAYGKMVPVLRVSVTGGTTPTVASFTCVRDDILIGNLTVTRNGAGDVSLTWPANKFPASNTKPIVGVNGTAVKTANAAAITNGVRVYTWTPPSTAADSDFTVEVY